MTTYTMYKCIRCGKRGMASLLQLVEHYEVCPQPPVYIPHAISPAYTYTPPDPPEPPEPSSEDDDEGDFIDPTHVDLADR